MKNKRLQFFVTLLLSANLVLPNFVTSIAASVPGTGSVAAPKQGSSGNPQYIDISGHWAEKQILGLIKDGLVKGKAQGTGSYAIKPDDSITRGEFVTLLVKDMGLTVKKEGKKYFSDLKISDWYKNQVDAAVSNGLSSGYPDKTFRAGSPISRGEIAAMISKAYGFINEEGSGTKASFKDVATKDWYFSFVNACKKAGIMKGYGDGSFLPKNNATRAEAFAILANIHGKKSGESPIAKPQTLAENKPGKDYGTNKEVKTTALQPGQAQSTGNSVKKPTEAPKVSVPSKESLVVAIATKAPEKPIIPAPPVSRGDDARLRMDLKPAISFDKPFGPGKDSIETKEVSMIITGSIFGNHPKSIGIDIVNDNGDGKKVSVVSAAYPEFLSVAREVYTSKIEWRFNIPKVWDSNF